MLHFAVTRMTLLVPVTLLTKSTDVPMLAVVRRQLASPSSTGSRPHAETSRKCLFRALCHRLAVSRTEVQLDLILPPIR